MPLVSVVVPVYNVEPYLRATLASIAQQTVGDLEVLVVDDGSGDGSAAIAEEVAAGDPRFRVIRQPNGGLGNARNNGADAATGEFLAFVDGDDVLPRNAYELLLEALGESGSDFATGNVHRLTEGGATSQAPFLARTFAQTRLATHVTKFRPLLEDRIVPNKLWRRSFWDAQGFRFPEGMLHEDIPVVIPAQFAARSVDVIAEPVYLYRVREGADLSITQRRAQTQALLDRLRAIELVLAHFDRTGTRRARRWYERSVVAHDLSYYLNVLDIADEEYRALFLERVNGLLDQASARGLYRGLLAIDRLKWHLVRRRLLDELLEVLRFQRERLHDTPPVRIRRRWYGDYPFRTDRRLRIPRSVYRLDRELTLSPHLDELRWDGDKLRIEGHAFIGGLGAPDRGSQRVTLSVLKPGRLRPVRQRLLPVRMSTSATARPDATAGVRQSWCDATWSGFVGTLDARKLRRLGRWRGGRWELYITVRSRGVTRRRARFAVDGTRALRAADSALPAGVLVRAAPGPTGQVTIRVDERWALVSRHRLSGEVAEAFGVLGGALGSGRAALQLTGAGSLEYPLEIEDGGFRARVRLADLEAGRRDWDLYVADDRGRRRVAMSGDIREGIWSAGRDFLLHRTRGGDALLSDRAGVVLVTEAHWTSDGELELKGALPASRAPAELVLTGREQLERHSFPIRGGGGRFEARIAPARVPSIGGVLPLRADDWDMHVRPDGDEQPLPLLVSQALYGRLPLTAGVGHKRFALGVTGDERAQLAVQPDLDEDERGPFHQRRLRESSYAGRRAEPLRDAVVYASFGGQQYSDSPRAIYEELVRREAALEHLWVVRDGMCRVPPTATVLREGSREYHEALARARFLVTNDPLPAWFARRADQTYLQTSQEPEADAQYAISPNRVSTPLLRKRFAGEVLETGLPRVDVLFRPDRDDLARRLRERLAVPEGRRVVLYAPRYREHVVDSQGRHRLDVHLDLERLRAAVGDDTVILFRKDHRITDAVPATADGFLRDVSSYPDATELLLVADVLVTDYASLMFDFANTGRPMLFFAYDLDAHRDSLSFDYERTVPGPVLRTTDELAVALAEVSSIPPEYADRYREFVTTFCEFDDGRAASRVVDRVFY